MKKEMLEALSSRYPGKAIKAYMNSIGWTRVVNSFVLDMGSTVFSSSKVFAQQVIQSVLEWQIHSVP